MRRQCAFAGSAGDFRNVDVRRYSDLSLASNLLAYELRIVNRRFNAFIADQSCKGSRSSWVDCELWMNQ